MLVIGCYTALGHTLPVAEILAYLNSEPVKEAAGVEKANADEKLPRLLIVEVNEKWFKLEPKERIEAAKRWHAAWTHTVPQGIVSIIEKGSGDALVSFRADGRIDLMK